ncbi:MAG: SDR family NAD(P)-dependent oxidoreductase, partial [Rhizobiales bacterium]|nr:SDR family NAD(P)-dependent oxidoreductase [Hyphomicrobiales bacterium]
MGALANRHALVTGGGSGIGAAITRTLAEAGATVTITGRDRGKLNAAAEDSRIRAIVADVTDEAAMVAAFRDAVEAAGPISIVIANAGAA